MHQPTKAKYHVDTGLVSLTFEKDGACEEFHRKEAIKQSRDVTCRRCDMAKSNNGSYVGSHMIRGAIVWPVGDIPGYILVSGQDQSNKTIWIFRESPFTIIGTGSDGFGGLWISLKQNLEGFLCRKYFYAESPEHPRYSAQVRREPLVETKPVFIEIKKELIGTKNRDNVDNLILEYQSQDKIKYDRDAEFNEREYGGLKGNLYKQVRAWQEGNVLDEDELPAYKALRALIAGYEWRPHRKPGPEQKVPESYYQ
jgi:hypothetical protein